MPKITNIHSTSWTEQATPRGTWRYIDLSGERLGVRVEELAPGETSSVHHFHTAEEEHVIALDGDATLLVGSETVPLRAGDVVIYPEHQVMLVKGLGFKQYTYRPVRDDSDS